MRNDVFVFIMAGGIGTRFWPASQKNYAKQFHRLVDENRSLIQSTYDRFLKLIPKERIYVITSEEQVKMTKDHLPDLQDHQIIAEPSRKNTGPATLLGSKIAEHLSPGSNCLFTPADATITDIDDFLYNIDKALTFTSTQDGIVTIGISPTEAHTGYGYIQYTHMGSSPYTVNSFTEKPDRQSAEKYLKAGNYLWNAGIFIWRSDYILNLFYQLATDMFTQFEHLHFKSDGSIDKDSLSRIYHSIESESVDYLIMEKAPEVYTIPGSFGWSDVGNWRALHEYLSKDENQNVIQAKKHHVIDVSNSFIKSETGKLIVAKNLDGYVVVETNKTLLIYPIDEEQSIKQIREEVKDKFGEEYI